MIMELTKEANKLGYQVTHLLIDGQFTGLNHSRKRFFFIATKYNLNPHRLKFCTGTYNRRSFKSICR